MPLFSPFAGYLASLRKGDRGARVSELQRDLKGLSQGIGQVDIPGVFGAVTVTGEFDDRTEAAVRLMQAMWKLPPSGVADTDVLKALMLARTPIGRFHDIGIVRSPELEHLYSTLIFLPNQMMVPRAVSSFSCSAGVRDMMLFDETGGQYETTAYMHYPGDPSDKDNKSGVTLGPGFDFAYRPNIAASLSKVGVKPEIAAKVEKEAGGLTHQAAKDYADKNGARGAKLIHLDKRQQSDLQSAYLPDYEAVVQRNVTIPLVQCEFDALVSFAANPGGSIKPVTTPLNRGEVSAALSAILRRIPPEGSHIRKGLMNRRRREVQWFVAGRYTV